MRSRTEIGILTLTVKADDFFFRKIFDEFDLIGFILFLHKGDGFLSRKCKIFQLQIFLYDLLHLRLQSL